MPKYRKKPVVIEAFRWNGKNAHALATWAANADFEARKRLDFRDPKTMALQFSIDVPGCPGVNHADFSIDHSFAIFTCEFAGTLVKIDLASRKVLGYLKLQMPKVRYKEVKLAPGQLWFGPPRGSDLSNFLGGPLPNSSSHVALSLQNPSYGLPSFVNATGNGANLWRTFTYPQLANATARGLALQASFANIDTDNPDLSAFQNRGSKLLMYHGLADSLIKPAGSVHYYNRVLQQMGGIGAVQNFYRFYLVPGMFHGFSNGSANRSAIPPLPTNAQLYQALTDWVEKGIAPDRLEIASAVTAQEPVAKTYPLCPYPKKAVFTAGDPKVTASYACR